MTLTAAPGSISSPCPPCVAHPAAELNRSELARRGWWSVGRLLSANAVDALAREAIACHASAIVQHSSVPHDEDSGPRGQPARWLESAPGGEWLRAFYRAPWLARHLHSLTGLRWRPSGGDGTYSYYRQAGHHLDLHRDVDECDLAVITCLLRGGDHVVRLRLFPGRAREPISAIRATQEVGAIDVDLAVGESIVLLGGHVPHCVPPLADGQLRVVAPLCFTVG